MNHPYGYVAPTGATRTPQQVKAQHVADAVARPPAAPLQPARANDHYRARYLDNVAPGSAGTRLIKFGRDGRFVTTDGVQIPEDDDFVALCGEVKVGWIKFNGEGVPPDRHQGLLYQNFTPPPREELGDLDQSQWPAGLSGRPEDPWLHEMALPLQRGATREAYSFATRTNTGRRAIGTLLRHYDRVRQTAPNDVPIVKLKTGGFNHRDPRIGWIPCPVFAVVGWRGSSNPAPSADLNDEIPL